MNNASVKGFAFGVAAVVVGLWAYNQLNKTTATAP